MAWLDPATGAIDSAVQSYPVSRFTLPNAAGAKTDEFTSDQTEFLRKRWEGARSLTAKEIEELANKIVLEVRQRGPFLSLGEFVNRRLESGGNGLKGALQDAIDQTSINDSFKTTSTPIAASDTDAVGSADKGGYKPVAKVNLPASCKRTIVVLIPNPAEAELPFSALAMDADPLVFKLGTRRLINLSKAPIRGEIGAQPFVRGSDKNGRFVCQPGKIIDVPALDKNAKAWTSYPIILEYYGFEKWNTLSSTRWFYTPTQRHLVFVYYDTVRNSVVLRGISDSDNNQEPNNKGQEE